MLIPPNGSFSSKHDTFAERSSLLTYLFQIHKDDGLENFWAFRRLYVWRAPHNQNNTYLCMSAHSEPYFRYGENVLQVTSRMKLRVSFQSLHTEIVVLVQWEDRSDPPPWAPSQTNRTWRFVIRQFFWMRCAEHLEYSTQCHILRHHCIQFIFNFIRGFWWHDIECAIAPYFWMLKAAKQKLSIAPQNGDSHFICCCFGLIIEALI